MTSPIDERQNAADNLRMLAAARRRHSDRKRAHRWRMFGTVVIAAASPAVVVFKAEWGPALGAVAGVWVVLARTLLASLEEQSLDDARRMQEEFDCRVLALPRNPATGPRPTPEAAVAAADRYGDTSPLRDWYPAKDLQGDGPREVLICQRSSVAWGQRLHYGYAWSLGVAAAAVAVAGIVAFALRDLTLSEYLVAIFLPSLPALLDATELVRQHLSASKAKGAIEADMTEDLSRSPTAVDVTACRAYQDRIFSQRGADPAVSDHYYRLRRSAYERHMVEGAKQLSASQQGD